MFNFWFPDWVLAAIFLGAGALKLVQSPARTRQTLPVVAHLSDARIRGLATLEVLGGVGVAAPGIVGVFPVLTPLAATGLAMMMVVAGSMHARRREWPNVAVTVGVFALAVWVAALRWIGWA